MNKKLMTLITTLSFMSIMHADNILEKDYAAYENFFKPLNFKKKSKAKPVKIIDFTPEELFGGHQAQGYYNPKLQIAVIKNNDTTYDFIKIFSNRTNPSIPDKKNIDPNLQLIGSYNTKTNHAGMPVTTYLFGVLNKNESLQKNNVPVETNKTAIDTEKNNSFVQPPLGNNPATWAPIMFYPSDQFAGNGLVGNYFSATHVATIHDPLGINNKSYTFKNVQEGGLEEPKGLILIGTYGSKPQCHKNICSHAMIIINLYGTLQQDS